MDYANPHKKRIYGTLSILLFLAISYALCFPLLRELYQSCRGDWDYFFFLYEVPSISLFEYRQIPLWNPYCGGGMPFVGNPQAGFPSLTFLFTSLFGVIAGLKISVWVHTFLGLWGMWLLSGHMGVSGPARLAPSLIFMLSSSWALHLAEGHIVWLPAALLPFFFLAFLKGLDNKRWLLAAAVVESLMFYEGGTYVLAFSLLFVSVYAVCHAIETRNWQPIIAFTAVNLLAAALSAPKLLPVLNLLASHPRQMEAGGAISWDDYLALLLERSSSLDPASLESGSYLGIVVVVFYLFSLSLYKKHRALVIASLFILLLSLGNFSEFAPWTILHELPLFRSFQIPTRSLIVFNFSVALLIGLYMGKPGIRTDIRATFLLGIVIVFIGMDLFLLSSRIFAEAPKPVEVFFFRFNGPMHLQEPPKLYHVPPAATTGLWHSVVSVHRPFSQIRIPDLERFVHGAWSDQYLPLLQNRGVVDAYEPIQFERHARAVNDEEYKGEFYFVGKGEVSLRSWSPNKFTFHIKLQEKDRLVVNQNYWPGWLASRGVLTPHEGLLAIDLSPGEYDIEVSYFPNSFLLGICIFFTTLAGIVVYILEDRGKSCVDHGTSI
ncbi:MAG: hypothetical protein NDI77_02350 [Geobacteraceae bacterium]|nr:hypothetical protein [Geobacteraceae bacterium]